MIFTYNFYIEIISMNIFFLSLNPKTCAQYYCDKHVVKIILEIVQMLWAAHRSLGTENLPDYAYKQTHIRHPMTLWVRSDKDNYEFTVNLGKELCQEYTRRYHKTHACEKHLTYLSENYPKFQDIIEIQGKRYATKNNPQNCTPVPLCMPEEYHDDDLVEAYRKYYLGDKARFAVWKYTSIPEWFTNQV